MTVNGVSKLDGYPIQKIDDLFGNLSGGTTFTNVDLQRAFQ